MKRFVRPDIWWNLNRLRGPFSQTGSSILLLDLRGKYLISQFAGELSLAKQAVHLDILGLQIVDGRPHLLAGLDGDRSGWVF